MGPSEPCLCLAVCEMLPEGFQFFPKEGCVADVTQLGLEEEQVGREHKGFGESLTDGWESQAEYRASNREGGS